LNFPSLTNSQAIDYRRLPVVDKENFRQKIIKNVHSGCRLSCLFGVPEKYFSGNSSDLRLFAVLAEDGGVSLCSTRVGTSYPSLTPDCPQAHLFEREIWEQYGVKPENHPSLKPVRFQEPCQDFSSKAKKTNIGSTDFFKIEGAEIHEVAVGPVHAGIIEPGHFRFQCHGENVYNLEISLGYQHRGIERALQGGPDKRSIFYLETTAGDTTVGHTTAYAQIMEALTDTVVPEKGYAIRAIALELERIANHIGDLGALSGDIGYLPTKSFCGRIRGNFLNLTADICGNRFGRGLIKPGGVDYGIDSALALELSENIRKLMKETEGAVSLLWKSNSVLSRFERTGIVTEKMCEDLGLVGPVARASNSRQDVRSDLPFGIYTREKIPVAVTEGGDVYARAYIRWLEIKNSGQYILQLLKGMSGGTVFSQPVTDPSYKIVVSLVEGWRGEICHVAITDAQGKFIRYKIVDPSFHNWMGLAMVLRNEAISDFPLCNKSFNLSYCGHDL